jgi:hypothetical protein
MNALPGYHDQLHDGPGLSSFYFTVEKEGSYNAK